MHLLMRRVARRNASPKSAEFVLLRLVRSPALVPGAIERGGYSSPTKRLLHALVGQRWFGEVRELGLFFVGSRKHLH